MIPATLLPLALALAPGTGVPGPAEPPAAATLTLPAWSGYCSPDAAAARRDRAERVTDFSGELAFYVRCARTGRLDVEVHLAPGAGGATSPLTAALAPQRGHGETPIPLGSQGEGVLAGAPVFVAEPGYHRIVLRRAGGAAGALASPLVSIALGGPAAEGATATTVERRNAASVHLGYPRPRDGAGAERDDVEWFHCRVTPRHDPLWTYYEATGWHRGYFGMQVNSPTERRVIFSVWDSGEEAVDRGKVAAEDLVQLVARGEDVVASGFGNEGTGGHSHLVFDWRLGDSVDFLVRAQPEGAHTTYTGWFRVAARAEGALGRDGAWRLVASFRAPKDGRHLRGLYSFNENFWGANGDRRRVAEFDEQWVRTADGVWHELTEARFTCDGHGKPDPATGQPGRLDRSGGVRGSAFYLAHGGFVDDPTPGAVTEPGGRLRREGRGGAGPLTDAELAALPLR